MAIRLARYSSSLTAAITAGDTTLHVASVPPITDFVQGVDYVYISLVDPSDSNNLEVTRCSAFDDQLNELTVVRGRAETTAKPWAQGTFVVISNDPIALMEYIEQEVAGQGGGSGLTRTQVQALIASWAQTGASWGALDGAGPADITDGFRMLIQNDTGTETDHVTIGELTAKINEDITTDGVNLAAVQAAIAAYGEPFTSTDETKLAGIEDNAKDDQSAAEVPVDASGFDGNLNTSDDNVQKVAQAVDDLPQAKSHAQVGGGKTPAYDVEFPDRAPDGIRSIKDIVGEVQSPAEAMATFQGGDQSQERIWSANFNVDGNDILLEYRPVTASGGTGTNPGTYVLEGPDDFLTSFTGRGSVTRIFLSVAGGMQFGADVSDGGTTPFDDPRRREIRSTMPNPSDPTGLRAPADQTTTPTVALTLDFEFADGTNLYDGQLQPRARDAGEVFTAAQAAQLHALEQPGAFLNSTDVKDYARTGQRKIAATDMQIKPEEVVNAFEGGGWVADGGVTQLRSTAYTASDIAAATFAVSQTQGPHLTNNYIGIRIPIASKPDIAEFRVYIGENDGEDYHTLYPASGWTWLVDDATYAYYTQQITDHPAGDWFGVQKIDQLRLDDEAGAATLDAVLTAGTGLRKTTTETGVTLDVTLSGGGGGLNQAAVDARIVDGVKEFARTGERKVAATDMQTKPEEVVNAFEGDAWSPQGGVTTLRAAAYTASNIVSQSFAASRTQGPHLTNNYVGIRIPVDDKDNLANLRLYIGENDGEDYHTIYPGTGWTHLIDSVGNAYYTQQVSDHPAGDWFGVQGFETLRLDDEAAAATIDAVLVAGTGVTKTATDTTVTLTATGGGIPDDNSVSTAKIQDGAVNGNKIADGSITTQKVVNNAITEDKLAVNSVTASQDCGQRSHAFEGQLRARSSELPEMS